MTTKAEVKDIVQDWCLLVYDIPAKEKKLRAQVLKEIHMLGGMIHTDSCYLVPLGDKALELANKLADKGQAVVWKSHQADKKKAQELTVSYDTYLEARCNRIEQRLQVAENYITQGRLLIAQKMATVTIKMIEELNQIGLSYHPEWFVSRAEEVLAMFKNVYGTGKSDE